MKNKQRSTPSNIGLVCFCHIFIQDYMILRSAGQDKINVYEMQEVNVSIEHVHPIQCFKGNNVKFIIFYM